MTWAKMGEGIGIINADQGKGGKYLVLSPEEFTGKIVSVTINVKPSNLSATDKKSVEDAEEVAETIED